MAELDLLKATNTAIDVPDLQVESVSFGNEGSQLEGNVIEYDFPDAEKNQGYYKKIPELKKALDLLALWTCGKGFSVDTPRNEAILDRISGRGDEDIVSILWNMQVMKKVNGDAFAEIKRDNLGVLLNLIPISAEHVKVVTQFGRISKYKVRDNRGLEEKWVDIPTNKMLHFSNDRVGGEVRGTSIIDATQWVIDARNEALETNRMLQKRGRALGIVYYKTNNTGKISFANAQIEKSVKDGQMLGLPEGTAEIKPFPTKSLQDRMEWIRYLENFFYQAVGIPRVIATSEGFTEAGGKVGYLTFEPIYTFEQTIMEADIWNQLAIRIKFNKPASLSGTLQQDEEKNTGQLGFQPNDTQVTA